MLVAHPWKAGPLAAAGGPVFVSATKFIYRRRRTMPLVAMHALRLRRGWPGREGAVALRTAGEAARPVTISLSVWRGEEDLRRFLGSPEHVRLVRGFKRRLVTTHSVVFELASFDRRTAWEEGLRRLAARELESPPLPSGAGEPVE